MKNRRGPRFWAVSETLVVILLLLLGIFLRFSAIRRFPIRPESDYAIYYQAATLLAEGSLKWTESAVYISAYPHVFGYSYVLSLLFRITGPSLQAGLVLNLAASMLAAFFAYRAARLTGGRLCGVLVLAAGVLWPSQIVFGAMLAPESVFTCALMLIFWLFVRLWRGENGGRTLWLWALLGALTALAGAVRPMAQILLIAMLLCLLFRGRASEPPRIPFARRGWARALTMLLVYVLCARLISGVVNRAVGRPLASSGTAFGYNLMVGMNTQSDGAWNREDADFFNDVLAQTGDPRAAHGAALEKAINRIRANPRGVAALAWRKFAALWGNDDYGVDWVLVSLDQQGQLTPERRAALERLREANERFYGAALLLSALYGLWLRKRPGLGPASALMLLCIGTALLHLALETQNRYHYFILQALMLLSAQGLSDWTREKAKP